MKERKRLRYLEKGKKKGARQRRGCIYQEKEAFWYGGDCKESFLNREQCKRFKRHEHSPKHRSKKGKVSR